MIDFRKPKLFKREEGRMKRFLENKLVTVTEMNNTMDIGDDEEEIGMLDIGDDFLGGDSFDLGSDDFGLGGFDDFGGSGSDRNIDLANDKSYESGIWWKDVLLSPWYLFSYVGRLLAYDFPNREERRSIVEALRDVTKYTTIGSAILWLTGFEFIITLSFQTFTSGLMFLGSNLMLKYVYDKEPEEEESDDPFGNMGDDDIFGGDGGGLFGDSDEAFGFEEGSVGGYGDGTAVGLIETDDDDFSDLFNEDGDDDDIEEYVADLSSIKILPQSPIDISTRETFDRTILEVFADNVKYRGKRLNDRKEIVYSFAGYIITNDPNFGEWTTVRERSIEYNNISYALFKGLTQISTQFGKDEEKMTVLDIRHSPLLYRIEVELPSYFKEAQLKSRIGDIESALKKGDEDTEVQVLVSGYSGITVFKLLRLDNRNLISLGDIFRFYDEEEESTPLDACLNPKLGVPLLLGLRDMEHPYIVDLEANTSGVIVGGSGSGKSWLTFLLMFNIAYLNSYEEVQFVIMDLKNAPFWNQFARFPHVLGYHTESEDYLDILREMYAEVNRRKELLNELNAESMKGLREMLREDGDIEGLAEVPLLFIIIDEITSTMQELKTNYGEEEKELYKEVVAIMSKISQEGRSLGVRLISIGQRSTNDSIPKNVMANSSFKFGMKMNAESDFGLMFGKEADKVKRKPTEAGMGLALTEGDLSLSMVKTLTPGGQNDDQLLKLIRVVGLDWVRRTQGVHNLIPQPKGMDLKISYNRDKNIIASLEEIEQGKILTPNNIDEGFSESELLKGAPKGNIEEVKAEVEKDEIIDVLYGEEDDIGEEEDVLDLLNKFDDDGEDVVPDLLEDEVENTTGVGLGFDLDGLIDDILGGMDEDTPLESTTIDEEDGEEEEEEEELDDFLDSELDDLINSTMTDVIELGEDEEEEEDHPSEIEEGTIYEEDIFSEDTDNEVGEEEMNGKPSLTDHMTLGDKLGDVDNLMDSILGGGEDKAEEDTVEKEEESLVKEEPTPEREPEQEEPVVRRPKKIKKKVVKKRPQRVVRKKVVRRKPVREPEIDLDNMGIQEDRDDLSLLGTDVNEIDRSLDTGSRGGVTLKIEDEVDDRLPNLHLKPIKEYIIEKGERIGVRNYRIEQQELVQIYGEEKVIEALDMYVIIPDGEYYLIKI